MIITIDGPSGAGKERIARYIKHKYNFYHLDSGLFYRHLAAILDNNKININNNKLLIKTLNSIKILSQHKSLHLRSEKIARKASIIATKKIVRKFVDKQQHIVVKNKLKSFKGCVVDGRDIGSKVFKNAKIKLFIEVNVEIRAKRRHKQLIEQDEKIIYSQILKDLKLRDKKDLNRKISPLVKPHNAIVIDNSNSFYLTCKQINFFLQKIEPRI
tara:strand:+ start:172 stop:813 length:642 start_codon:yes stop_codon:yes gene_type:complete